MVVWRVVRVRVRVRVSVKVRVRVGARVRVRVGARVRVRVSANLAGGGVAHVQLNIGRRERDAHVAQAEHVAEGAHERQRRHVAQADDGDLGRVSVRARVGG